MLRAKNNLVASVSGLIVRVIGFRSSDVDDAVAIKDLKKLESICISFNILPNGFSQDPSVTPSKWNTIKSFLYSIIMTVNITHLVLLSIFDLPDEWLLVLGDFFCGKKNRRFFWLLWLIASIVAEILRHYWIFLIKNGRLSTLQLYYSIYLNGFKSGVLSMNQFYCLKFRFVAINLTVIWVWIVSCVAISFAPILIFIVHSAPQKPQTSMQFIYTSFWLLVNYLGIVSTLYNMILPGAIVTVHLSYFYFRAVNVARTVQNLATEKGILNKTDYLLHYKDAVCEIIKYQNEIEQLNINFRNWLIFLYIGISFAADFGAYIAIFVHIDQFMDLFVVGVSVIGVVAIGACSYTNGVILTMVATEKTQFGKTVTNEHKLSSISYFFRF